MTFTATFPIGYAPGSPRELYNEDEPLVVEFDADVRVEQDPVEVDWPPVVERGVSVDCDASSVEIESAMLDVKCKECRGSGRMTEKFPGRHVAHNCSVCWGDGHQPTDILPTLSAPDLTRLKEDCAEWAREHAVEQN